HEIPLGHQLRIGIDHRPTGEAEIVRQPPARWHRRPRRESGPVDRIAQRLLERSPPTSGRADVEIEVDVRRTGPLPRHETGSYERTTLRARSDSERARDNHGLRTPDRCEVLPSHHL